MNPSRRHWRDPWALTKPVVAALAMVRTLGVELSDLGGKPLYRPAGLARAGMDRVRRRLSAPRERLPIEGFMADDPDDDQTEASLDPPDEEALDDDDVLDDHEVLDDEDEVDDDDDGVEEFPDAEFSDDEESEEDSVDKPAPTKRGKTKVAEPAGDEEEGGEEDDDEPDPDDVEADLDTILKDRLVVADDEDDDEEDEVPETDEKVEGGKVRPRAPGEFVCQSCFLVKHPSQVADGETLLCRDCV